MGGTGVGPCQPSEALGVDDDEGQLLRKQGMPTNDGGFPGDFAPQISKLRDFYAVHAPMKTLDQVVNIIGGRVGQENWEEALNFALFVKYGSSPGMGRP